MRSREANQMRKSKPRTETRASQSRELGELSALARVGEERKHKRLLWPLTQRRTIFNWRALLFVN
nr:MAG TPA: hypothetical protein [Caudoviricetes sp.]